MEITIAPGGTIRQRERRFLECAPNPLMLAGWNDPKRKYLGFQKRDTIKQHRVMVIICANHLCDGAYETDNLLLYGGNQEVRTTMPIHLLRKPGCLPLRFDYAY